MVRRSVIMVAVRNSFGDLRRSVSALEGLRLLVLYGSRARRDAHERSDWDFGYLADDGFDSLELRAMLSHTLHTDDVDAANLDAAGAVLRHRVACQGTVIFERSPGLFDDFRYEAILFWLDAGETIRSESQEVLERLG